MNARDSTLEMPSWLAPQPHLQLLAPIPSSAPSSTPTISEDGRILMEMTFQNLFERALEQIVMGRPLSHILKDDPRNIDYPKFMRWMHKDPQRQQRYYEAREIGCELIVDELITIADAQDDNMEDVQRSSLRIGTRKWYLQVCNRKRYGESKQLDINTTTTVDMRQLLEIRDQRLQGSTYESTEQPRQITSSDDTVLIEG